MFKSLLLVFCLGLGQLLSAQQTFNRTIQHGGLTRQYNIYIPALYNAASPVPLLFNLHGYGSDNSQQAFYGEFRNIADTANFIIIHPNGTFDQSGSRYWNVGFGPSPIDDVSFILALIDTVSASYNINFSRIYSTGMSNGGFMSYKLACDATDVFAAVASVTGSMTVTEYNNCSPSRTIPTMQIHGTLDGTVPYAGSALFAPIEDVVAYWKNFNACGPGSMTNVPNTNTTDGATAEHYVYPASVAGGPTVEFFKVINGAHTWPGALIPIGTTCMDFSASKEIWRFFSQYSSNYTGNRAVEPIQNIKLWPNPVSDLLYLDLGEQSPSSFQILDVHGRMVQDGFLMQGQSSISVGLLQSGIYFVRLQAEGQTGLSRFVKQ